MKNWITSTVALACLLAVGPSQAQKLPLHVAAQALWAAAELTPVLPMKPEPVAQATQAPCQACQDKALAGLAACRENRRAGDDRRAADDCESQAGDRMLAGQARAAAATAGGARRAPSQAGGDD